MTHAWVDGRLVRTDDARVSVADRSFQLGDGIFETLRARRGIPIEWDEHLARLGESASALAIPLPDGVGERLRDAVDELLGVAGLTEDAALRITVSRGSLAGRGLLPPGWEAARPTIVLQAFAYAPPPALVLERGVRAITSAIRRDARSPLAGVKSTSRADHVHAKLEAHRAGVDEAVFLTGEGFVSEATTANIFAIAGSRVVTPPRSAAILAGTTRSWVLAHAGEALPAVVAEERDLRPDDLVAAGEAFLSSSVAGIVPLVELDGRPIGSGRPGERTLALREAREGWIDGCARAAASPVR